MAAFVFAALGAPAKAGENVWTWVGPADTSRIRVVAVSGESVWAAETSSVYKSDDGGSSWAAVLQEYALSFAIDPSSPTTVYVGVQGGVRKTQDGGRTWDHVNDKMFSVESLAVDPNRPSTVYAGPRGDLYKTTDAGKSWARTTLDVGGFLDPVGGLGVDDLGTVYAGARNGVWRSRDRGTTWTKILDDPDWLPLVLAVGSASPSAVYASIGNAWRTRLLRSPDRGESWDDFVFSQNTPSAFAIDPSDPRVVYMSLQNGVLRSADGGLHWQDISAGLTDYRVVSVAIDPLSPTTVYAATREAGIFKFTWVPSRMPIERPPERPSAPRIPFRPD